MDVRLIPGFRGAASLDAEEEEGLQEWYKISVDKRFKEADVDAITAAALLPELGNDFGRDLVYREERLPDVRWNLDLGASGV